MYSYTQMCPVQETFILFLFQPLLSNILKSCTFCTQGSKEENVFNLVSYRSYTLLAQLSFTIAVISK